VEVEVRKVVEEISPPHLFLVDLACSETATGIAPTNITMLEAG